MHRGRLVTRQRRTWRLLSSCAMLLLLLLLVAVTATAASARDDVHTTTIVLDSACPRCPLCEAAGVPLTTRLLHCDAVSTTALSLARAVARTLTRVAPLSRRPRRRDAHVAARYPRELPFATDTAMRDEALRNVHELLHTRLVGQPHVVRALLPLLRRKLTYPSDPLVLHFAGDNGVGKTHTARLLSLALSLRCAPARGACDAGDALLVIPGTGFDSVPVATARRRIVQLVSRHMRHYPHGVVLLDDLTAMPPPLVAALAPLFGRGTHFPEQLVAHAVDEDDEDEDDADPDKEQAAVTKGTSARATTTGDVLDAESVPSLSQLLVIATTDFGKAGRTTGRSVRDIERLVRREFASVYGTLLPSYTRTFAFLPFTEAVAEEMIHAVVATLPCLLPAAAASSAVAAQQRRTLRASTIAPLAARFLVAQHRATWQRSENGHALRRVIEDELVTQIVDYYARYGLDRQLAAHFVLDAAQHRVVLRNDMDHENGDGNDDDGDGDDGDDDGGAGDETDSNVTAATDL